MMTTDNLASTSGLATVSAGAHGQDIDLHGIISELYQTEKEKKMSKRVSPSKKGMQSEQYSSFLFDHSVIDDDGSVTSSHPHLIASSRSPPLSSGRGGSNKHTNSTIFIPGGTSASGSGPAGKGPISAFSPSGPSGRLQGIISGNAGFGSMADSDSGGAAHQSSTIDLDDEATIAETDFHLEEVLQNMERDQQKRERNERKIKAYRAFHDSAGIDEFTEGASVRRLQGGGNRGNIMMGSSGSSVQSGISVQSAFSSMQSVGLGPRVGVGAGVGVGPLGAGPMHSPSSLNMTAPAAAESSYRSQRSKGMRRNKAKSAGSGPSGRF